MFAYSYLFSPKCSWLLAVVMVLNNPIHFISLFLIGNIKGVICPIILSQTNKKQNPSVCLRGIQIQYVAATDRNLGPFLILYNQT